MADENLDQPAPKTIPTRDDVRAAIFAPKKPKAVTITFFGQQLELRQPSLGQILAVKDGDLNSAAISTLIDYSYIPGTDIHPFEKGDAESLLGMPFGQDFVEVTQALEKLTSVNFTGNDKSSSNETTSSK